MVKSWEERYSQLYRPKTENTKKEPTSAPTEESTLTAFNEYVKTLDPKIKFNKRRLFEIYKEHGENAFDIYLRQNTSSRPATSHKTLSITEAEPTPKTEQPEPEHTPPADKPETPVTEKPEGKQEDKAENNWVDAYEQSFSGWVKNNTFKQDGTPKRTMTAVKTEDTLDIDLAPATPSPRRADKGASYHFENGETEDKIEVTVTNKNNEKPLNYDYVYALVKTAKANGVDTIEFKDIKTVEFANMLMVASVQFGMKMQNQPEYMIDDSAAYIPAKLKEKIAKYNADKKPLPGKAPRNEDEAPSVQPRPKRKFTPRPQSRELD